MKDDTIDMEVKVSRLGKLHPNRHLGVYFASHQYLHAYADSLSTVLRKLATEIKRDYEREQATRER